MRMRAAWVIALAMAAAGSMRAGASAEVLDATYRGTLVCDRMPAMGANLREAIEVTIAGGTVRYSEVVRLTKSRAESGVEKGAGTLDGQHLELHGQWENRGRRYEANYAGDFVRRSARLKGTQTWTVGDKTATRSCAGAVKRPLKAFLHQR